jgi:hypothetical protein
MGYDIVKPQIGRCAMFEKKLQAFSYAVGITFIVLAILNVINLIVYSMMDARVLDFWPFTIVSAREMMGYMLNVKLLGVFFGAVFLVSYIWGRRLRKISS